MWEVNGVAFICKKSGEPGYNKDNFFCIQNSFTKDKHIVFGVFEGQGQYGHIVSCITQRLFSKLLVKNENFQDDPAKALAETHVEVSSYLRSLAVRTGYTFLLNDSNRTNVCIAIIRKNTICVSCEGESTSVYYSFNSNGKIEGQAETLNEINSELEFSGNTTLDQSVKYYLIALYYIFRFSIGDEQKEKRKVANKENIGKSHISISAEVKVKKIAIKRLQPEYLVIASKGIWEVMRKDEVGQVICLNMIKKEKEIAGIIVNQAIEKWKTSKKKSEDLTIILHKLQ